MKEATENKTTAYILIGVGAFFLITQVFNISLVAMLWPLFIIVPGLMFIYPAMTGGKHAAGLIFPGVIITGTGLILAYQNLTGHWESWAYGWVLYPVMVGMGLQFLGRRTGAHDEIKIGEHMVRYGLMAFAGFALFFELLIFDGLFGGLTGILWPIALLGMGYYLLFRRGRSSYPKRKNRIPKRKHEISTSDVTSELHREVAHAQERIQDGMPDND